MPFLVAKCSRADVGQWTKCSENSQVKKSKRCSVTLTGVSVWLIISWGVGGSWGEGRTRGGAGFPSHMH